MTSAAESNVVQLRAESVDLERLVHMTVTEGSDEAGWTVRCRQPCSFREGTFEQQHEARKTGDAHLKATLPAPETVAVPYDDFLATLETYQPPVELGLPGIAPIDPGDSATELPGMPTPTSPPPPRSGAIRFCWLGEDGEYALALGHLDEAGLRDFAAALADSTGSFGTSADDYPMDPVERLWILPAGHAAVCPRSTDDVDVDELQALALDVCGCSDEYVEGWYGTTATATTPGAVAITRWSA